MKQVNDFSLLQQVIEDPVKFYCLCWPDGKLYDKQVEIMRSVRDNPETVSHAGNKLGKDFISAVICLWFFLSREPVRVISSSSSEGQLEKVLWSEIKQRLDTSVVKFPLKVGHLEIKKIRPDGTLSPLSYMVGHVTKTIESFQGHHLPKDKPRVLALLDEASGIKREYYDACDSWAHRKLVIGNPLSNDGFFYDLSKGGDQTVNDKLYRKVIHIGADHSPNVRLAKKLKARGIEGPYPIVIPGVVDWDDYNNRLALWDAIKLEQRHRGFFYEGKELLMYPPELLDQAEEIYEHISRHQRRRAEGIGIDSGEGGDESSFFVVDRYGPIEEETFSTPNTMMVPGKAIALIKKHKIDPQRVYLDVGGGGKEHADRLREQGYNVSTVHFGERATLEEAPTGKTAIDSYERGQTFKNRRVEMYWMLRELIERGQFGIPREMTELRKELAPVPVCYDSEGTLFLPPKSHPNPDYKGKTIVQLVGHSPNRSDALVLAIFGMRRQTYTKVVKAF